MILVLRPVSSSTIVFFIVYQPAFSAAADAAAIPISNSMMQSMLPIVGEADDNDPSSSTRAAGVEPTNPIIRKKIKSG